MPIVLIIVMVAATVLACTGCTIPCKCEGGGPGGSGPVPMDPFDAGDAGDAMGD